MRALRVGALVAPFLLAACSAILGGPDLPDVSADAGRSDATAGDSSGSSGAGSSSGGGLDSTTEGALFDSSSSGGNPDSSGGSSGAFDSSTEEGSGSSSGVDASAQDTGSGQDTSVQETSAEDTGAQDTSAQETGAGADATDDGFDGNTCPVCTGGTVCQGGACVCPTGLHDCSGTCEDDTSNNSCGTLCTPCTGGTTCQVGSCQCPTGYHECSGTCDSDTSDNSCGTSCTPCLGGTTCQGGSCQCATGDHLCSGTCSSSSSTSSCGSLCTACSTPPSGEGTATCDGTSCGITCNQSYSLCSGDCVNEQTDPNHCDSCTTICPYGLCQTGECKLTAWGAGYPNPGTGGEVSIGEGTLVGVQVGGSNSSAVAIGVQTVDAGVKIRLALFSDNGNIPGSVLAQTAELTSVGNGRTEGSIPATATVVGHSYWLMILSSGTIHVTSETAMVTWYYETGVTYGPFPSSFSGSSSLTETRGDFYYITAP